MKIFSFYGIIIKVDPHNEKLRLTIVNYTKRITEFTMGKADMWLFVTHSCHNTRQLLLIRMLCATS